MATEVEQLYLQLELINIEEQMLKLQMLKHRRQRRRLRRSLRPAEAERVNVQHWLGIYNLDEQMHFRSFRMSTGRFDEFLRRIQPLRLEKATAGNYVLSGPITALTARVYATCS